MFFRLIDIETIRANNADIEGSSSSGRMPRFLSCQRAKHPVRNQSSLAQRYFFSKRCRFALRRLAESIILIFSAIVRATACLQAVSSALLASKQWHDKGTLTGRFHPAARLSTVAFFGLAFFGLSELAFSQVSTKSPLDAKRAFSYLRKICDIGTRVTGTKGMEKQQELLENHFAKLGSALIWQSFETRHPETGAKVMVKNLIVRWNPQLSERVFLCTHYDTRPFPVNDLRNPKGIFIGANDGASGTALFMELGNALEDLPMSVGVDFVFFDAEELVFEEPRDPFFVGSTHFANKYLEDTSSPRYRCGILVDMIGDSELQLFYEQNSYKLARPLVEEIWGIAKELNVKEFKPMIGYEIKDDHLPLNTIAKIPVIDIIDFDYTRGAAKGKSFWHTMADTPDKCSGASMVKVGVVLLEWIKRLK